VNERARVPFALVGVVLLVSSAAFSGALGGVQPVRESPTEAAMEDARRSLHGDLADATRSAARDAAAAPVVTTANTTLGRTLAASESPFRTALALRIYLAVRDRVEPSNRRGVTVAAELPAPRNRTALRETLERMTVDRVGESGTLLRVTLSNVTLAASRAGATVDRATVTPTVTVTAPVLLLHDRTARFDERLDADATAPGLARRTTARLSAIAWARGLAQYGSAPIANVVANRHVAVATNSALLAEQRTVFGAADDAGARATRIAASRAAGTDLLTAAGASGSMPARIIDGVDGVTPGTSLDPVRSDWAPTDGPTEVLTVGANDAADSAYRRFTDGGLGAAVNETYQVTVERRVSTTQLGIEHTGRVEPSGDGWAHNGTSRSTSMAIADGNESAVDADTDGAWHSLSAAERVVTERETTTRRWRRGNETTTTTRTVTRTVRVRIIIVGRHDGGPAPGGRIDPVHEPGGRLDAQNLVGVEERAHARLVANDGGMNAVARAAVSGTLRTNRTTVRGRQPDGIRSWIRRDLGVVRKQLLNTSVQVQRGALGTYRANPHARLADAVERRRAALVAAPAVYDGVADRARVAARGAYVDAVVSSLRARARRQESTGDRFDDVLAGYGLSRDRLAALAAARDEAIRPSSRSIRGSVTSHELVVEGAPAYLTLSRVPRAATDATGAGTHRPLAARNRNVFTVPYEDASDTVVDTLFPPDRVRLRSAAAALRAAERLDRNETPRKQLRAAVRAAIDRRRAALRRELADAGIGDSAADRRAVVTAALSRWTTTSTRAVVVANGSAATAVADAAVRRYPDEFTNASARHSLEAELRDVSTTGRGVPEPVVNESVATARRAAGELAKQAAARAANETASAAMERAERRIGRSLARVPAGLPVTPVPAQWYVTTNVWTVAVEGSYDRFAVRARDAGPGRALTYVRDGSAVRIDWDDDGDAEHAGRANEVSLSVRTAVVVVVPPGGQGVGDTDGNADERSGGWRSIRSASAENGGVATTREAAHRG